MTAAPKTAPPIPLWVKIPYTLMVAVVVVVYWIKYGPANFLWFSDIAFFAMCYVLWCDDRFVTSMMAIGVLPLETFWVVSYLSGFVLDGHALLGVGNYMFDDTLPLWLRGLSLFHFPMIFAVVYMLWRRGYDPRALVPQVILSLVVLIMTHLWAIPEDNVNMIYPPGDIANLIPQSVWSALMPAVLVGCIIVPMHLLLSKIAPMKD